MFTFQKIISKIFKNFKDKEVIHIYNELLKKQYQSKESINQYQIKKINQILEHSINKVPFYSENLKKNEFLKKNNFKITELSDLQYLPIISKKSIIKNYDKMVSSDSFKRMSFENSTGGSTGQPLNIIQDKKYQNHNLANFLLAKNWRDVDIFGFTAILWGAEEDIFNGEKSIRSYISDYLNNSKTFNSFSMTENDYKDFITFLNNKKPELIHSYVQSIYDVAKYISENNITIAKQNAIHIAAGTYHDFMRKEIESIFQCESFNHYGSREAGTIASECISHEGLHELSHNVYIEIINQDGKLCSSGEDGEIIVTLLHNYSMPLIRYNIEDIGALMADEDCCCGIKYKKLKHVKGRNVDIFKTKTGKKIDGEYFTHLFYHIQGVEQFQIIQENFDLINVNLVINNKFDRKTILDLEKKMLVPLDKSCKINFNFMKEIKKTKSGKFIFTISKVK